MKPGQDVGITGATRRPSKVGRIPRIHWVAATKAHAAVPVSHALRAMPNCGWVGPQMFCE